MEDDKLVILTIFVVPAPIKFIVNSAVVRIADSRRESRLLIDES